MQILGALSPSQWVLLVAVFLSVYGVGQVWLVQLSSYHLWAFVGPRELATYHMEWWRSIWFVVLVPAGLVFLASALMLLMRPAGISLSMLMLGFALEGLLLLGTAAYWGPLMARLATPEGGLILPLYRELMLTHWIRVALVTAYGLLTFWMLVKSMMAAGPMTGNP